MSGEKQGRREQIDRFVKQMVKAGHNHNYIKAKAIQSAIKADRSDNSNGGK